MMDGRGGLTPSDIDIVHLLRRTEKQVFFVVNKIDSPQQETELLCLVLGNRRGKTVAAVR